MPPKPIDEDAIYQFGGNTSTLIPQMHPEQVKPDSRSHSDLMLIPLPENNQPFVQPSDPPPTWSITPRHLEYKPHGPALQPCLGQQLTTCKIPYDYPFDIDLADAFL